VSLSMRRCVLSLISSQVVTRRDELGSFFENTLFWHQLLERNPKQLDDVTSKASKAVGWLLQHRLIEEEGPFLLPTPIGKAVAQSGLLPSTAVKFLEMLQSRGSAIEADFENHVCGLIHWVCCCDEFKSERAPRFLPFPTKGYTNSSGVLGSKALLHPLDRT